MKKSTILKHNLSQILALTEKDIKLKTRYKFSFIVSFINPIISIFMPLIIMNSFFNIQSNADFGNWTAETYSVFVILVYNITLLRQNIMTYPQNISREKFWQTLQGLMIAPFNLLNLLIGIFLSHLVLISIPFIIFLVVCYIFFPISIITLIFVFIIFLLIALIFNGIGLILGVFAISNENVYEILVFSLTFIFWFSAISYPYALFPEYIQQVINLNPLYYIFDFLRVAWVTDDVILTIVSYPFNFIILILTSILLPCIGILIFKKVYKKFGIAGY